MGRIKDLSPDEMVQRFGGGRMTKEEAVARIKEHIEIHRYNERNAVKILEALEMAIKALEQPEPCEDWELDETFNKDKVTE